MHTKQCTVQEPFISFTKVSFIKEAIYLSMAQQAHNNLIYNDRSLPGKASEVNYR